MARNKYPEETVQRILDVSLRLFLEQGYDGTTIQDIIDHLGGLSKGAIYHHFKSKEQIFEAVLERLYQHKEAELEAILRVPGVTGLERLSRILYASLGDPKQDQLFIIAPNMLKNARFLGIQMMEVSEASKQFVAPVIREGMRDGSIRANHPDEVAELLLLIANFWLNPLVFEADEAAIVQKCHVCREWLAIYGMESLLDEKNEAILRRYCQLVARTRNK